MRCAPLPASALRYRGSTATSVLPSPVFISAILRGDSVLAPTSWTAKGRKPVVRGAASQTTAKASTSRSSSASPFSSRWRNSGVFARSSLSVSFSISGSSSLMSATRSRCRLTSRAFGSPRTLVRTLMDYTLMPQPVSIPALWRPKRRLGLGQIRFQQAEGPVVAPVEQIELLAVFVQEKEEGVAQFVHLLARQVLRHGPHLEALDPGHSVRPHGGSCGLGRGCADGRRGLGAAVVLELLLVLAGLPGHLVGPEVDRLVPVVGRPVRLAGVVG